MIELPGLWSLAPIPALLGVVVLFYFYIAGGRLIPKKTHDLIVAAERLRGDEWKAASDKKQEVIDAQAGQITALAESARTTTAILKASAPPDFDALHTTGGA